MTRSTPRRLQVLHEQIEGRAARTRAAYPWWPCARGCASCCQTLPRLPVVTSEEWSLLREAVESLRVEVRQGVEARLQRAASAPAGPLTCPLLDPAARTCLVYAARPVVCRTYGFYAGRDGGRHCEEVGRQVAIRGAAAEVIWGHEEGVQRALREGGPREASLDAWWSEIPPRGVGRPHSRSSRSSNSD